MEYSFTVDFFGGAGGGSPSARQVWGAGEEGLALALLRGFGGGRSGGAGAPQDEPRDPKRKKEKPREVKIL